MREAGWGAALLPGLLAIGLAGCGGALEGQKETAAVTGSVAYKGQPLKVGQVTFIPADQGKGNRAAYGTVDGSGRYRLTTYNEGDGAIPGKYQVVVRSEEEVTEDVATTKGKRLPKSLIPTKFADPAKSGLTAEVKSGRNEINFDLKD